MEHNFSPTTYYSTIGTHEPALIVSSGDTVTTTTLDCDGWDSEGHFVGPSGNPQTGPIYVKGAQPNDTLKIRFDRIWPNRSHGFCSNRIASHILEPDDSNSLSENAQLNFSLDFESGTASANDDLKSTDNIIVPIRPMLGCFGVAPARNQSISTATSGPYGGNMDYKGFSPGVTAYLPIFVDGALLHLGDGHAWQADGEILGSGVEISMDVTITVDVIKDSEIEWPRGENNEYIFTAGNARPLEEATQYATSEMIRWLQKDYALSRNRAHSLLGMYVEYEIGNIYDPAFTMICKLPKSVLPNQ